MQLLSWSMAIHGTGHYEKNSARLVLTIEVRCPACRICRKHEGDAMFSEPMGATARSIYWLAHDITGQNGGVFCEQCGVLSRCPQFDSLIQDLEVRVTPQLLKGWVAKLPLERIRAPDSKRDIVYSLFRGPKDLAQVIASSAAQPAS